jgi:phosphatidate cytidylyltransferase
MLSKKIISSLLITALLGSIIFFLPNWVYLILVILLVGKGLDEFFSIIERKGIYVYRKLIIAVGCLIPVAVYLSLETDTAYLELLCYVIAFLVVFLQQFIKDKKSDNHIIGVAVAIFGLLYISCSLSFSIKIIDFPQGPALIPRISPNKTLEGAMGGLIVSTLLAVLSRGLMGLSLVHALILGLFLAVVAQFGDFAESLIKRNCHVKDTGTLVPGFGGLLDLIDSLLFTSPIFYLYLRILLQL